MIKWTRKKSYKLTIHQDNEKIDDEPHYSQTSGGCGTPPNVLLYNNKKPYTPIIWKVCDLDGPYYNVSSKDFDELKKRVEQLEQIITDLKK